MTTKRLTPEDRRALEHWEQYYNNLRNAAVVDLNESPTEIEGYRCNYIIYWNNEVKK